MDDKLEIQSPSKPSSTLYGRLKFRLLQQAYFTGYAKKQIPRGIRRLLARTEIGVWGAMEPKTNVSSESHRKGAFRSPAHPPGITL